MKKIIDYKILQSEASSSLTGHVKHNIANGWQPKGGGFAIGKWFYQTMVKYEEISEIASEKKEEQTLKEHRQWQGAAIA